MATRAVFDHVKGGLRSKGNSEEVDQYESKLHIPVGNDVEELHHPKDEVTLTAFLNGKGKQLDVDAIDPGKERAPIHSIICNQKQDKFELLFALLIHGNVDVDLTDLDGMSPLHLAVQMNDLHCVKLLVAFGAKVNALNKDGLSPLDLAYSVSHKIYVKQAQPQNSIQSWLEISLEEEQTTTGFTVIDSPIETHASSGYSSLTKPDETDSGQFRSERQFVESEMMQFLHSVGGHRSSTLNEDSTLRESRIADLESTYPALRMEESEMYNKGASTRALYKELDDKLKKEMDEYRSLENIGEIVANEKQRKEIARYKKTGSKILCLDGGGIRGLIEIDLLHQLEMATGKKVTELFDWIVGTSTGAVLALCLVYGKLSLTELRRLFFKLKEDVFSNPKLGFAYDTDALETILQNVLGTEIKMSDVKHPKVVVAAVHKETTPLQLHFFNNCFDDKLSEEEVWKVARCTSGGPLLFAECNNYVDGGVLANNPTEQGVTKIQNFHWEKGEKLPISLVVSLGTGVSPTEKLGSVDAQDCLGIGRDILKVRGRVGNVMQLFFKALGESEMVAESCKRNFTEQGIPYYRFSPHLNEVISSGETDDRKLLEMILLTRRETWKEVLDLPKLFLGDT